MIHPLVQSWPLMMTRRVVYAPRSYIHSLQVAELINSGRDVIALVVAEVKSTTLVQLLYQTVLQLPHLQLTHRLILQMLHPILQLLHQLLYLVLQLTHHLILHLLHQLILQLTHPLILQQNHHLNHLAL